MITLIPDVNGCLIVRENFEEYIRGFPSTVIHEVIPRICYGVNNCGQPRQIIDVKLEVGGIGAEYQRAFDGMGIHYTSIKPKSLELFLPIIDKERNINT